MERDRRGAGVDLSHARLTRHHPDPHHLQQVLARGWNAD